MGSMGVAVACGDTVDEDRVRLAAGAVRITFS
jgi:hypothetical protein